jgi:hypothetical protein
VKLTFGDQTLSELFLLSRPSRSPLPSLNARNAAQFEIREDFEGEEYSRFTCSISGILSVTATSLDSWFAFPDDSAGALINSRSKYNVGRKTVSSNSPSYKGHLDQSPRAYGLVCTHEVHANETHQSMVHRRNTFRVGICRCWKVD